MKIIRYFSRNLRRFSSESALVDHPGYTVTCTMIPGDGVGPELMDSVRTIFKQLAVPVKFEVHHISELEPEKSVPITTVLESIRRNRVAIQGTIVAPMKEHIVKSGDLRTVSMQLRNILDLYANVAHVQTLPGVQTRHANVDFILIREHTEGEYSAIEHESIKGVVESLKIMTEKKIVRIAKFAFDYATKKGRKRVTAVHKANIMKIADGLFLRCCREMAQHYPAIKFESMIVDNCTMQMVSNPQQFDVMVTPNLYGNILDNLGAGLVGGAGVVPGASYSTDYVVFEPGARHSFLPAAGKGIANPTAIILCAINMLSHVNLNSYAEIIHKALQKVLENGKIKTRDLGGTASTQEFTQAVLDSVVK